MGGEEDGAGATGICCVPETGVSRLAGSRRKSGGVFPGYNERVVAYVPSYTWSSRESSLSTSFWRSAGSFSRGRVSGSRRFGRLCTVVVVSSLPDISAGFNWGERSYLLHCSSCPVKCSVLVEKVGSDKTDFPDSACQGRL